MKSASLFGTTHLALGVLVLLASTASAQMLPPGRPRTPPPPSPPSLIDIFEAAGPEAKDVITPGHLHIANTLLQEFVTDQQHYAAQANRYSQIVFSLRVIALMSSISAALTLAFLAGERGRKVALGLSIAAAAVPAVDQIFQVSHMYKASWRATVDMSRTYDQCTDIFVKLASLPGRGSAFSAAIDQCRSAQSKVVDAEMEISLKPLESPTRIEIKQ